MPLSRSTPRWPTRISWPRRETPTLSALTAMTPEPVSYVRGKSRFVLSPLYLTLDQMMLLITAALLCFGLIMVQSADTRIYGVTDHWLLESLKNKNAIHAVIAMLGMVLLWRMDYRKLLGRDLLRSPTTVMIALTILCLVLVLSPMGMVVNGAKRWLAIPLGVGKFSFQPSEFAKLGLVLFLSAYAVHKAETIRKFWKGFVPLLAIFGITALLIVKEDFGTTALVAIVGVVLLLMAGCRWWHVGLLLPPAGVGAYFLLWHSAFRRARLLSYLHPEVDPKGVGYHPLQSLLTIANGGLWGKGLGNGTFKMGFLPEDNTDFIFAVICEELGVVGAGMVIGLFIALAVIGWRIAARCDNLFGKMIAFGVTATIALQAALNVAVVTVTVPTKGIALPFISSGGTGWIMNAIAIGVLMSVERITRQQMREARRVISPSEGAGFPVVMSAPMVGAV
jgi:cell division protein FtsW